MRQRRQPTDAEMKERALARWEGEGGALAPRHDADSINETELRILARLGAALLEDWDRLDADLQRNILRRARSLGARGDHTHVKTTLARFLRENR